RYLGEHLRLRMGTMLKSLRGESHAVDLERSGSRHETTTAALPTTLIRTNVARDEADQQIWIGSKVIARL
ncbi:MAG: hypothetical protein ACJ8BH_04840, partial [Microvirga sp.]